MARVVARPLSFRRPAPAADTARPAAARVLRAPEAAGVIPVAACCRSLCPVGGTTSCVRPADLHNLNDFLPNRQTIFWRAACIIGVDPAKGRMGRCGGRDSLPARRARTALCGWRKPQASIGLSTGSGMVNAAAENRGARPSRHHILRFGNRQAAIERPVWAVRTRGKASARVDLVDERLMFSAGSPGCARAARCTRKACPAQGPAGGNEGRKWSGRRDSNSRPSVPKTDALPGCATPRLGPV